MNLNNFLKDDRRWTALTLAVLAIGILWTLASLVPVAATTGGAPPPSPREGFSAPDFTLDLLDGGQDRPASRRIFLWSEYRHPIRVYEILAALGIFLFTMKLPLAKSGRGLNFSLAIALSAGARLLLEAFRGESLIWPGGIRAAQAVSLIILGISLRLMRAWSQSQIQSQAQTDWLSPIARLCKPFAGRCQLAIFLGAGRGLGLRVGSHGADPHRSQPL